MRSLNIEPINKGIHNILDPEIIPRGAASRSLNWRTVDDHIELSRGRTLIGARETGDGVRGQWVGYKHNGEAVHFRKIATAIQYFNNDTDLWVDVITGLTDGAEYSFANYASLAGNFTYAGGVDGLYKINLANPASYADVYDASKNFRGKLIIDKARMFMWDIEADPTGLYLSHIDEQNYTLESSEVIGTGDGSTTTFTGTLSFKGSNATASAFGIEISDGVETFTDDGNGVLTGSAGGTGTINYMTGAFELNFNTAVTNTTDIEADYQWEDSNDGGITDFTYTSPARAAGEGDVFRQDVGGDRIVNVEIYEGIYYSLKERSVYELSLSTDDTQATNQVFRKGIGMKYWRSSISTGQGIVFMNTANPEKPELTIIKRNPLGDDLIPDNLVPHFKFSDYTWDECALQTYGERIYITGKTGEVAYNDRLLEFNPSQSSIDVLKYSVNTFVEIAGLLYVGHSVTDNVFLLFNGFSDDETALENYWEGREETYDTDNIKKLKRVRLKGFITQGIEIQVYCSYDEGNYQLVGTVLGVGNHIDAGSQFLVGTNEVGSTEVGGGGQGLTASPFYIEFKVGSSKFGKRKWKFIADGFGLAGIRLIQDRDYRLYPSRLPSKYRKKDNVSRDGSQTNMADPE